MSKIREVGVDLGLRKIKKWNLSAILSRLNEKGFASHAGGGWIALDEGLRHLSDSELAAVRRPALSNIAEDLRNEVQLISDAESRDFVREAIECFDAGLNRAAVVLSWVGAMSVLHKHILNDRKRLSSFNSEASSRFANSNKWQRPVKKSDDFGQLSESEQLMVMEKSGIIGKNVKQELEKCLDLRNGCGHPNSLIVGENRVAAHLEILIQNVFRRYSA